MSIFGAVILIAIGVYVYRTFFASKPYETKDERYNAERHQKQMELDRLLDKVSAKGIDSLSDHERQRLQELSKR